MGGVQSKNSKVKKECLDLVASLVEELNDEFFTAKDVKIIIKEVDSHDKFTRASALEACVEVYKVIGDKFWTMAGKNINQKVKDLITSKFSNVPKTQINSSRKTVPHEKPLQKASKPAAPNNQPTKTLKPPMSSMKKFSPQPKSDSKLAPPSKLPGFSPQPKDQPMQKNKSIKKFIRKDSGQAKKEVKVEPEEAKSEEKVAEAILTAKPVDELINLDDLDSTGKTLEKILYGSIEEKVDALVIFNEVLTLKAPGAKVSLSQNAEFAARTFSDVLDGIFFRYREGDFPAVFVKYMLQVFKKCF